MADSEAPLRFDHREIVVIFSLFVFISLLMFTVGILVGKGLTQAKYEGYLDLHKKSESQRLARLNEPPQSTGSSVTLGSSKPVELKKETPPAPDALELIPQKDRLPSSSLREPDSKKPELSEALKHPGLENYLEGEPKPRQSSNNKVDTYAQGKFTVQIGSYPTEKDARDRIDSLKGLGFPHAYLSRNEIGDSKDTWYRVWLGYFPDFQTANEGGKRLQERGEVKNYLVRKADTSG